MESENKTGLNENPTIAEIAAATMPPMPTVSGIEPKILAANMGISAKRLRAMLRAGSPRDTGDKGKRWLMTPEFAAKVQKEYADKKAAKEIAEKAAVAAQLAGAVAKDAAPAVVPAPVVVPGVVVPFVPAPAVKPVVSRHNPQQPPKR